MITIVSSSLWISIMLLAMGASTIYRMSNGRFKHYSLGSGGIGFMEQDHGIKMERPLACAKEVVEKDGIGPESGKASTFVHFQSPWGSMFELVSFPNGRAYEQDHERLWVPDKASS